jgi:hypothetical protein
VPAQLRLAPVRHFPFTLTAAEVKPLLPAQKDAEGNDSERFQNVVDAATALAVWDAFEAKLKRYQAAAAAAAAGAGAGGADSTPRPSGAGGSDAPPSA